MSKIRFAVIGAGWISQEAFLPAVKQTGNAEVTAIVSGDAAKARALADFHGIADVYDYDGFSAMAASGKVDAVYIATPNSSHCAFAQLAAQHKLHIMVEKPLATTVAEGQAMIDAATAASVRLMTAYRLHNDAATVRVAELIRTGVIGDARFFSSVFAFPSAPGNHRLKAAHWGGPLQDVGVYCLNAARHLFGANPVRACATASHGNGDARFTEVEEGMAVTLDFPQGRMAQFYAGFGSDSLDVLHVTGTLGTITLHNAYRFGMPRTLTVQRNDQCEVEHFDATDNFSGMIAYFADCLQQGAAPLADGAEGLADMVAMVAIERAAKTSVVQDIAALPPVPVYGADMVRRFPPVKARLLI